MFMNDITKCYNETCNKKEECYRYVVLSDIYQSYAKFELDVNGNCEFFIDISL
jgi:hypothetical protein